MALCTLCQKQQQPLLATRAKAAQKPNTSDFMSGLFLESAGADGSTRTPLDIVGITGRIEQFPLTGKICRSCPIRIVLEVFTMRAVHAGVRVESRSQRQYAFRE
jgi:hypothetical protein